MIKLFSVAFCLVIFSESQGQHNFNSYPVYTGNDLGLTYTKNFSIFKIWSPVADSAQLVLYKDGVEGQTFSRKNMQKSNSGTWQLKVSGNLKNLFYAFRVMVNGKWSDEVPDPYAKAVGINGKRAEVVDLSSTNPPGWASDKLAAPVNTTKDIVYELHIRDVSIDDNSGISHKGKFLGLAETGTKNKNGLATGLDHLKELGVTHIHLLPFFDFNSVDESKPDSAQYNWGYDPLNYNAPEGSYSTNANDGAMRIKECKQMIKALHSAGLHVVMDVVYNHTGLTKNSYFNELVPGYYYRHKADGSFSNATACGNETASDEPMMRKFMMESVLYWAREYHIDGFRFDLMGVHDIETMNEISDSLHKINPGILLYGEGWTAGDCPLPGSLRAIKKNAYKLHNIAVFSDDVRDGLKGSVFDINDRGFISNKPGMDESVKFGIVASTQNSEVNDDEVNYSKASYAAGPFNTITYLECHDNNVLYDKLKLSYPDVGEEDRKQMQMLGLTVVLTSQGIPFLHAGTEFLRTKHCVENSFNTGDSINEIDWDLKTKNLDVTNYVEGLIAMRKAHPSFTMATTKEIESNLHFEKENEQNLIVYTLNGAAEHDSWSKILIALNGSNQTKTIQLPAGEWNVAVLNNAFQPGNTKTKYVLLNKYSAMVFYQQ